MNPKQTSVLIVDDDPLFRQSLRIVLNQMPQAWHCYEAESVHEAIIRLAQHSISLAIVDIHLPDGTAADIVRSPGAPPCVLCTQDDKEPTFRRMFADASIAQNLVGYLTKPLQQNAIWSIRAALEIGEERRMRSRLIAEATAQLEGERRMIARNLHGALGSDMTQLNWIFLSIARAASTSSIDPRVAEEITLACAEGKKILSHACSDVSQAVTQLRPDAVGVAGLKSAIEDIVAQWRRAAPRARFELLLGTFLDNIDSRRTGIIYRLVQEGITNVMRHTDPVRVLVETNDRDTSLILKIFSTGKILVKKDFHKLTALRERASALGGVLQFSCDAEKGETCLVVDIPV